MTIFLQLQAAYVYTPEVYPTFLRSVGVGSCSGMARLGATLTPYIAQVLMKKSVHLAVAVYVAVALIAAFACVMLPFETKGHDLSDNNRGKSNLKSWSKLHQKVPKSHHNSLLPFIFHSFTVIFYKYFFLNPEWIYKNKLLIIDKVQKFRNFFTDDRLLMVTIDVMPLDTIGIKVVQNSNASFVFASLALFPVIWLSPSNSVQIKKS